LIVGWCRQFLFFVVPLQFSQDIGEWEKMGENQTLIPDWTYFHCPGSKGSSSMGENQTLIPDWTYFHCPGSKGSSSCSCLVSSGLLS